MMLLKRFAALAPLVLLVSACSYAIGVAQTREEFVTQMKEGGFMRDAESLTVNRPFKAVAADVRAFADSCLNVTKRTFGNYATQSGNSVIYYHPKIDVSTAGLVTLSLQGEQPHLHGQPAGGLFSLVAETRAGKGGTTRMELYYRGTYDFVAEQLKLWANGQKGKCPEFT